MNKFKLDKEGFIKNWLVTDVLETEIPEEIEGVKSQNPMPTFLRTIPVKEAIFDEDMTHPPKEEIALNKNSALGTPWRYYQAGTNNFVDFSKFFYSRKKAEFHAVTTIVSERDTAVCARIWHHPCLHIWLNDEPVYHERHLRHFPINYSDITLNLKKGENRLFVRIQGLGVIILNNRFAVQIKEQSGITVKLPGDDAQYTDVIAADEWLWSLSATSKALAGGAPPKSEVRLTLDNGVSEWAVADERERTDAVWKNGTEWALDKPYTRVIAKMTVNGQELVRRFELCENIKPKFEKNPEKNDDFFKKYLLKSGAGFNETHYGVLAKLLSDTASSDDMRVLNTVIDGVEQRIDCSDFAVSALIRIFAKCSDRIPPQVKERIRRTIIEFKYWVDEAGHDSMAMITENHSLMFHACQRAAGMMFPNERFKSSGRSGKEQAEIALGRINDWFDVKEKEGLHEFNSTSYMVITVGALLMVVDFSGDDTLAKRAAKMIDTIFEFIALHTFRGVTYAPQGRMYRGGINPFTTSSQAMLHYAYRAAAISYNPWLGALYCSEYTPPALDTLVKKNADKEYTVANTRIKLKKTNDYIITSIQVGQGEEAFKPGDIPDYEHQEHLWFAAVDSDIAVFCNHPSVTYDLAIVRPGFWFGNGVYPTLYQSGRTVFCEYDIPQSLPVQFTHCYFPVRKFDNCVVEENFLFGQKGDSYVGISCSAALIPHNDVMQDCEFRAYGNKVKWKCVCGSKSEDGSFEAFIQSVK